ncbi:Lipase class 3 [Penicillium taxi]|uniref:Lipase class 3 n=1 Tax=Penicillium taxi TaxID=168475 RepID=UPI0025450770|nr:Lipase class 3 [Penicillium taxi]KAJ5894177.1 Lipase class 3 [Penicillium taxi]
MLRSALGLIFTLTLATIVPASFDLARRGIPPSLLDDFNLFAQYAALAGCDQNNNKTRDGKPLVCDPGFGLCDLVSHNNTNITMSFHSKTGPTGYVALNHDQKRIILSFRGSVSRSDWKTDRDAFHKTSIPKICTNCYAHHGFWNYWQQVANNVTELLNNTVIDYPDYKLDIVGHSLGGALATLAGTELQAKGFPHLRIWTFGSPKVGNFKLAEFITNKISNIYRVTHASDPVPLQPGLWDWSHPSPEYWINQPTNEQLNVTADVVEVIYGIDSEDGNTGQHGSLRKNTADHLWYFQAMGVCKQPADFDPDYGFGDGDGEL